MDENLVNDKNVKAISDAFNNLAMAINNLSHSVDKMAQSISSDQQKASELSLNDKIQQNQNKELLSLFSSFVNNLSNNGYELSKVSSSNLDSVKSKSLEVGVSTQLSDNNENKLDQKNDLSIQQSNILDKTQETNLLQNNLAPVNNSNIDVNSIVQDNILPENQLEVVPMGDMLKEFFTERSVNVVKIGLYEAETTFWSKLTAALAINYQKLQNFVHAVKSSQGNFGNRSTFSLKNLNKETKDVIISFSNMLYRNALLEEYHYYPR
jgi:hypothetical protein